MPPSLQALEVQQTIDAARSTGLHASPADWRDQVIYFLLVDRFNRPGVPPAHEPFDDPDYYGFQGGSYSGIRDKLGYIKDLGAGAIWLAPVLKNLQFDTGSYHGYGIHDFLSAEPRFADDPSNADEELRALVDDAHSHGLFVVLDIVLNHVGDVFAYQCPPGDNTCAQSSGAQAGFQASPIPIEWRTAYGSPEPEWTDIEAIAPRPPSALVWPAELQDNQFFRRQGGPSPDDDTIGDFASLKQMCTGDPSVQEILIKAYEYVIARYDVDGFRIDTLRYLKGDLPRLFGNAMREFALSVGKRNFFTFGELLDQNAEQDIARFIGRNTQDPTLPQFVGVDAALDYPLFNALKPVVKGFAPPSAVTQMYELRKSAEQDILSSHGDATRYFVTFLDNHDMKERIRYVDPADEHRYDDQVTMGFACLYSLPGIPCLYYGTEQGLHGHGSDPAVREALWGGPGFDPTNSFYEHLQQIAAVRNNTAALRYGRFYMRPVSGDGVNFGISTFASGVLAFARILADIEITVVANTSTSQGLSVAVIVDSELSAPPKAGSLLYSNKTNPSAPGAVEVFESVVVTDADGSSTTGAVIAVRVQLQPLEAQIIRYS